MWPEGVGTHRRPGDVAVPVGAGLGLTGLLIIVIGTFLPWLRSGSVLRDSYQAVGLLRSLLGQQAGGLDVLLTGWLAVVPVCSACVALFALRLRRISAALGCLIGLFAGAVGGILSSRDANPAGLVGLVSAGPATTLVGAVLTLAGAIIVLIGLRGRRARAVGVSS